MRAISPNDPFFRPNGTEGNEGNEARTFSSFPSFASVAMLGFGALQHSFVSEKSEDEDEDDFPKRPLLPAQRNRR